MKLDPIRSLYHAAMQLIQIVPGLPPRVDSIGDYTLQMARHLRAEHGIETRFLVGDPEWDGGETVEGFAVAKVLERSEEGLLGSITTLERETGTLPILVQFSVYGYERRGCPVWMAKGLEALYCTRTKGLHVAFHELENRSWKPWSSVFWVTGLQKRLIARIARVCTFRYTNTEEYRGKLEGWGLGRISLIPNFSPLGEPMLYPAFDARRPEMVVFGRGAQRRWTYERAGHLLGPLCRQLGIERIVDIGQPLEGIADTFDDIPLVRLGRLPEEEVNARMAAAMGSFMQYPVPVLTKSSVHAVSCAYGTIPFVFDGGTKERSCPLLVTGEDFVPVDGDPSGLELPSLELLSRQIFENYQLRSSRRAAATVAQHLTATR
ncbi:hypothetical protein [Tunturiibacter gelidoferens]|uniref:Glycosyltransferase family 4 protein n=1 Tax=Tunturiibacter gelidiferens TaxID=3069689 RepID=A0A9X0QJQ5_9BACT|nr:hypothetical protein [Edaphobacter lichenicola]MBB5331661.1 hypothetical protein [Edaphobacter lichenicola]